MPKYPAISTEGLSFEEFTDMSGPNKDRRRLLMNPVDENRIFHCLVAQQFTREIIESLCELATKIRKMARSRKGAGFLRTVLVDKQGLLYFGQPSTRTLLSFGHACNWLGMRTSSIQDSTLSSEAKGETLEDNIQTISSYCDIVIIRHPKKQYAHRAAWHLNRTKRPIPVINAGSGPDQHPTQALLDTYTLRYSFSNHLQPGIDGKTIMMVGDLKRGRTVRSLCYMLSKYEGVRIVLVAPPELKMEKDITSYLDKKGIEYIESGDFLATLREMGREIDAIYMTRVQREHDVKKQFPRREIPLVPGLVDEGKAEEALDILGKASESLGKRRESDELFAKWQKDFAFRAEHLELIGENTILMHPGPRNEEFDPKTDIDPRSVYWRQMRNGMWIRAALLVYILEREEEVLSWEAS